MKKRDNILGDLLVETRFTDKSRYCIEAKELDEIERAARMTPALYSNVGCIGAMQIDLQHRQMLLLPKQVVDDARAHMEFLHERIAELEERLRVANIG